MNENKSGKKKSYYINEANIIKIDELKMEKGFTSMNQVLTYLFEKEQENLKNDYKNLNDKLAVIDKTSEMILEIVSWSADRHDHIPMLSYKEGQTISYNKAKEFVEENKQQTIKKKKDSFFL